MDSWHKSDSGVFVERHVEFVRFLLDISLCVGSLGISDFVESVLDACPSEAVLLRRFLVYS